MKKFILPLIALLSILAALGFYFTNILMFMKRKDELTIREREIKANRWNPEDFDALPKEKVAIASPLGYRLDCLFISPHPTDKWVIFCHGITENKFNSIKYMTVFLDHGYNAILYDHRRHGGSGGQSSSYGYYEKMDLKAVVDELKKRYGQDVCFGIHGESMGAATALLYGGTIQDDAAFYVADCPFSTFKGQVAYRLKEETPLPSWLMLPLGDAFLKWRDGYQFKDVSPLLAVRNIEHPVLFIHSEQDAYIPATMSKELFEAKPGKKQIWIAPNGGHAQSYNENPEAYKKTIASFLESI
ncbi:alpha/beta hydrolase [Bacillus sp. 1P06AnD]|uniref:alpha/beta hydrolase n=1 Tax=Bacillus sp. 1P06AnD TaxID=3132208 RepID=UPI0039A13AA4